MSDFLTDTDFDRYKKLIYDASGITFSESNRSILESRLKERLRAAQMSTVGEYYQKILGDNEELKVLLDSVTTNLTRFFRNTAHIQTFEFYTIPKLVQIHNMIGGKTINIWSAGCSTGEEPYTLAMVLEETLPPGYDYQITASDISLKSLMIGKEGFYSKNRINGIPENYLAKYFTEMNDGYKVNDSIRNKIKFDYHNLKNDSGLRNLDVIFCRNVLIYFDQAAQKVVIDRFWESLSRTSFLFIGHSESLFGMETGFEFLKTDWACIYQKNDM
jgi:chemotaxis protein methyltransferase CheR